MLMVSVVVAFSNSVAAGSSGERRDHAAASGAAGAVRPDLVSTPVLPLSGSFADGNTASGSRWALGLFASVELTLLVLAPGGLLQRASVNLINPRFTIVAILIWLGYALAHAEVRETAVNHLQTQRWEQSLADLHSAESVPVVASHSLIPMFEGMVERAISRTSNLEDVDQLANAPRRPSSTSPRSPSLPAAAAAAGSKGQV